jgi:hypothetical protein
MDLTDELHGNSPIGSRQDEQAVIICLQFPIGKLQNKKALDAVFDLDDILQEVVETSGVGRYDGHEFRKGPEEESVSFFMYGKDAGRIYQELKPILQSLPISSGSYVLKRYSDFDEDLFPPRE